MITKGCVLHREAFGVGPAYAVQDHFGSAFRCITGPALAPGSIVESNVYRCEGDGDRWVVNYRILRRVHQNTVRAVLRRIGHGGVQLASGNWYEVLCD